jgi:hypothetical protein
VKAGVFSWKDELTKSQYTKSMPITIVRFGQTGQCGRAKYALLDRMDEEIKN